MITKFVTYSFEWKTHSIPRWHSRLSKKLGANWKFFKGNVNQENSKMTKLLIASRPLTLLSRISSKPLNSFVLPDAKLYCFKAMVHCFCCLFGLFFSLNLVSCSRGFQEGLSVAFLYESPYWSSQIKLNSFTFCCVVFSFLPNPFTASSETFSVNTFW